MISTVWKIDKLECIKVFENKSNVVYRIYYSLTAILDQYSASYQSSRELGFDPNAENFIEYENLTEDIVLGWLFSSLGEEQKLELEAVVTEKVSAQATAPIEEKELPWNNQDFEMVDPEAPPAPEPATNETVTDLGPVFPELVVEPTPEPEPEAPAPEPEAPAPEPTVTEPIPESDPVDPPQEPDPLNQENI